MTYDPFDLDSKTVAEELEERQRKAEQGNWYPASGGTEQPFRTRSGRRLQYMWQPSTGRHAYYDVETDLILDDEEAQSYLRNGDFDPKSVTAGDRLITPEGNEITVTRVLSERGATWVFFFDPGHSKFQAALGIEPVEDAQEFRRKGDREGWQYATNGAGMSENARGFHVFEMSGNKPLRQVNTKPLTLTKAKQLARIGAQKGKHARAVTTDPRGDDFRVVSRYEVGHRPNAETREEDYVTLVLDKDSQKKLVRWWKSQVGPLLPWEHRPAQLILVTNARDEDISKMPIGESWTVTVVGWAASDTVQVVAVDDGELGESEVPHILLASDGNISPLKARHASKELVARGFAPASGQLTLRGKVEVRMR